MFWATLVYIMNSKANQGYTKTLFSNKTKHDPLVAWVTKAMVHFRMSSL